jgi:rhamnosyltransferase
VTATERVCAVVVAYFPDEGFFDRLDSLLRQVPALIVVDNTPAEARRRSMMLPTAPGKEALLIENSENLGVGAALNQGLRQALAWNCDWLLTLDQDSHCHADMVEVLVRAASSRAPRPAIIGSNYLDTRNGTTKIRYDGSSERIEQQTVITSGSLVDVSFADAIGGFRADYFIDQLDHEFCLRARANGRCVAICCKPVMEHSVGEMGGAWLPWIGRLPNHGPSRKYYIARNSVVTIAAYWRLEPDWCLRRAIRLFLGLLVMSTVEDGRWSKMKAFAVGINDAIHRKMGPLQESHRWSHH